ncbi:MAG TPA: adenosylmethionine--8-amino-7-oxononanoate transaminase [Gammaproteobacteria bacterium]|jgi:adenosylmethionine-8-amino-7-oxononanoate aminotransferase|nr:adenosylmethionine--8-amino-7-oxononanoate transaminase [Gammaproteobacteria bacterium]
MDASHLWLPYRQMKTAPAPQVVRRTDGVRLYLADGRELIDGVASWWTACHGYNHPHIRAAVAAQLQRMPHVMLGGLVHEQAAELSRRLAALLPGELKHVFFSESGSVAVEVAMKIALQYRFNRGEPGRTRFVSFSHGYHGDTFMTMSVCDPEEGMHQLFGGVLPRQLVLPLPTTPDLAAEFESALAAHARELTAVILEPLVQAAGGMKFHSPEVLAHVAAVARRHGLLLILDEIATGFGRTGTLFACEQAGVMPDLITLSKALTGGTLPLAATVASSDVYTAFLSDDASHALMHGPTYSGNALACAAANASLDLFGSEPRLAQARAIEAQLRDGFAACRSLGGVADVRVKGAIGVVQLARTPRLEALRQRFVAHGVWVRPFGDVVYLMPPLVIGPDDLERLIAAVYNVLVEAAAAAEL